MREKYLKSGFGKRYLRNRLKRFLSPTGFTLLEVMVALALLTVGLLALLRFFPVADRLAKRGQDVTTATMLAQQKMEEIKEASESGWPGPCTPGAWSGIAGGTSGPCSDAKFEWEIRVAGVAGIGSLCEVTVNVYWIAADGAPGNRTGQRNVELVTNMARYTY